MKSRAEVSGRSRTESRLLKLLLLGFVGAAISGTALVGFALGDTLELRTGQIVQGRFVGGSPLNIRFEVDGKEQIFATKDVLNIGFSDVSDASNAPTPPAAPAPSADSAAAPATPAPVAQSAAAPPPTRSDLPDAPVANSAARRNPPAAQAITIPAGTSLLVRMVDGVDSSTSRVGDPFQASLESDLVVGDTVVAPKGADVFGELSQAKGGGKISGAAQLTLELTGIRINGKMLPVDSTTYDVAGKGRGTQSAERIGGGAVLGAVIGAIAGGGRGAAIGAGVGAGAGTAVQVMTHGEQVRIPSETLLEFKLEQDVTVPMPGTSN
ncbi:MAG: hypothetical protein P4L00_12265 [Candidatus Acidoferrales bacterium]|nr:hypothetical protein [Candidatus Acidoferrales bacterium]